MRVASSPSYSIQYRYFSFTPIHESIQLGHLVLLECRSSLPRLTHRHAAKLLEEHRVDAFYCLSLTNVGLNLAPPGGHGIGASSAGFLSCLITISIL